MNSILHETAAVAARSSVQLMRQLPGVDTLAAHTGLDRLYPPDPELEQLAGRVALIGSTTSVARVDKTADEMAGFTAHMLHRHKLLDERTPVEITSVVPEVAGHALVRNLGFEAHLLGEAIEEHGYPKPYVNEVPIVGRGQDSRQDMAHSVLHGFRRKYDYLRQAMLRLQGDDEPRILALGNIMHLSRVFEDIRPTNLKVGRFALLAELAEPPEKSRFVAH